VALDYNFNMLEYIIFTKKIHSEEEKYDLSLKISRRCCLRVWWSVIPRLSPVCGTCGLVSVEHRAGNARVLGSSQCVVHADLCRWSTELGMRGSWVRAPPEAARLICDDVRGSWVRVIGLLLMGVSVCNP